MRLLFTGGSGYIGSHTARCFLANTDAHITILDNLSTGFRQNFEYLHKVYGNRVELLEMDLGDTSGVAKILEDSSFLGCVHFAASLIVGESVQKPLQYYKNNVINTTNLIDLCARYGVKNFIFSSTAAVYGEPEPNLVPISECAPLAPINPYGASKMMSERVLEDTSKIGSINYVALRYFNVAGACSANTDENLAQGLGLGQRSKNATHLIKVAVECAVGKRKSMEIFGQDYDTKDGTCVRDYIHIDDLASAHLSAFEFLTDSGKSEVFNVGYNRGYSVKEVIECVKKVSGVDFVVNPAKRREGDPSMLIASNQKLLSHTSWKPKYDDLETIVQSAYKWELALKNQFS